MSETGATTYGDRELLEQFSRTGDERIFTVIVQRYTDFVFAACLRVLHDRAKAEEAAQETFFKLLRQPQAVDKTLAGWLHRVATRHCIDQLRREGRRKRRELAYAQESLRRVDTWGELSPHLDEALDALPESSRRLLIGHYLDGKTMRELADEEGSSPATVCRRMASALEGLRGQLRRRGVLVLAAAMGTLLAQQPAQAASPALHASLAKMALLGGAARSGAATAAGAAGGKGVVIASAAMVIAGFAAGLALWSGVTLPDWQRSAAVQVDPGGGGAAAAAVFDPRTTTVTNQQRAKARYLVISTDVTDMRSDRLVMVQDPSSLSGTNGDPAASIELAVVYADNRVAMVTRDEVDRALQAQTGRPLSEWSGEGVSRVELP